MACAGAVKVPLTPTLSLGEPPLCPARATSTTSCEEVEEVKSTSSQAIAVLLLNLSAWPFWYKVVLVTTLVPVGLLSKFSASTGATSVARTTLIGPSTPNTTPAANTASKQTMGWLSSSRGAARIVSDCRIMVSSTRCATLGGLLLITQGSAPPVTRAAYSFVRGVYVLQSTKEASELLRTPCMRTS